MNPYDLARAALAVTVLTFAGPVAATLISFSGTSSDGHAVSATADFTLDAAADTVVLKLTNTSATTLDAGELLTGIDFRIGGGLPATLTSATGVRRVVSGDGTFVDGVSPVALTWSRSMVGLSVLLDFTPNATDALIGPPAAGSYAGANGSIKGNAGHNPFAAETATFVFSVSGLSPGESVAVSNWRFGTTLQIASADIPEPVAATLAGTALATMGWSPARRRRTSA